MNLAKVMLCLASLTLFPGPAKAAKSNQLWVTGVVRAVAPNLITIIGPKGQDYDIVPTEDFTSRVAVGSEVTAQYTPEDGINKLVFLRYALENFFVPPDEIRENVKRVIVIPHPNVPESMDLINEIGKYLATNMGWYIAPSFLAEQLWKRSQKASTLDAIDPATGQFDQSRYLTSQTTLMTKLASKARVDAVLDATVEEVQAPYVGKGASWDDVNELIATKTAMAFGLLINLHMSGTVPASTVVMNLYDKQGKILWNRRRGFAILAWQTGTGVTFESRSLWEVYRNQAGVQAWLNATFARLVGPENQIVAGPKGKKKSQGY